MEVTTNAPQQPNAMGGAPTTTQDVNGQIQPRTADQLAAGTSPDQKTAGTPDVAQSAANQQNQTDGGKNPPPTTQPQTQNRLPLTRRGPIRHRRPRIRYDLSAAQRIRIA